MLFSNNKYSKLLILGISLIVSSVYAKDSKESSKYELDSTIVCDGQYYSEDHIKLDEFKDLKHKYDNQIREIKGELRNLSGEERIRANERIRILSKRSDQCSQYIDKLNKKIEAKYTDSNKK